MEEQNAEIICVCYIQKSLQGSTYMVAIRYGMKATKTRNSGISRISWMTSLESGHFVSETS